MRLIGFSTGALALGDFRKAVDMLVEAGVDAVELSALRTAELPPLVAAAPSLPLERFRHVSLHAPSRLSYGEEEEQVIRQLALLAERGWPVIVHPDVIRDFSGWRDFGARLWVENMDKRKPIGRTAAELQTIFDRLPQAGLCFDLAHARQCDPTMLEAYCILRDHGARLRQVHLSEVGSSSRHAPLSFGAIRDFLEVAPSIPMEIPIILESPVAPSKIPEEIRRARQALPDTSPAAVV